jgi:hypothetical protein
MPYSQFTSIGKAKEAFGLKTLEGGRFLPPTEPIVPSAALTAYLEESLPLVALASEKHVQKELFTQSAGSSTDIKSANQFVFWGRFYS